MSLINEALKKAQKQRAHEPALVLPSAPPPGPAPRVAKRSQPMPAQKLVLVGSICIALFFVVGGSAWYIVNHFLGSSDPVPAPAPKVASAPTSATPAPAAAATDATTPETPAAVSTTAAVSSPAAATESAAASTAVASAPAATTVVTVPDAPTPAPVVPTPSPEPAPAAVAPTIALYEIVPSPTPRPVAAPKVHLMAMVDGFKVAGIRASSSDPKVLMNDRVFRINDVVDRASGLRLTEINPDRIVFMDDAGATYTKGF